MSKVRLGLAVGLVLALASQGAMAQGKGVVKRGETVRVFSWAYFDTRCRVTEVPRIRVTSKPKLGKLTIGVGQIRINRVVDDRQSNCIGKTVKGTVVTYSAGGTKGIDSFSLSRKRQKGKDARHRIEMTVR